MVIEKLVKKLAGEIPVSEEELRHLVGEHLDFDLTKLDTSHITNMRKLFAYDPFFNQNIGGWDVSNVEDMREMFLGADKMQDKNKPKFKSLSETK
jgi:hypothetical protein